MLQNAFTVESVSQPLLISSGSVMTQMEQAVPDHILESFPFMFGSRHMETRQGHGGS